MQRLRDRLAGPYRRWGLAVLLATAVANVAITPFYPEQAQPVRWHGDPDLSHLVETERESVDLRFGFYEDLRAAAAGGALIVPPGSIVDPHVADGLSLLDVVERDYDPAIDSTGLPDPVAKGLHDGSGADVAYEVLPGIAVVWWYAIDGDVVVIVPESLIPVPEVTDG